MQLYRRRRPWGLELTGFGRPMGLGFDSQGCLLATDMDCHLLVRLTPQLDAFQCHRGTAFGWGNWHPLRDGGAPGRAQRTPEGFHGPHSVQETVQGRLLVTCYYTPWIASIRPDGEVETVADGAVLKGPATTRLDPAGRLLVAEYALNIVLRLGADGSAPEMLGRDPASGPLCFAPGHGGVAASRLTGSLDRPHMAISGPDGTVFVADTWNHRLQRFTADGRFEACNEGDAGWSDTAAAPADAPALHGPVAIDLLPGGELLVTCWGSGDVIRLDATGRKQSLHTLPTLSKPYDARFHDGRVVVADTHRGRVLVVDNPF